MRGAKLDFRINSLSIIGGKKGTTDPEFKSKNIVYKIFIKRVREGYIHQSEAGDYLGQVL